MKWIALIHSELFYYRDNADDFIGANRFSDLLVKVNLEESEYVSVSKTSAAVDVHAPSTSARPSCYPDGTKGVGVCLCVFVWCCGSPAPG